MSESNNRMDELRQSAEAVGKLAENEQAFSAVVAAFQQKNVEGFQAALSSVGLLGRCRLICRFFCSKHCIYACLKLSRDLPERTNQLPIDEWRQFALVLARIANDAAVLQQLVSVVEQENSAEYAAIVKRLQLAPYSYQLCHWLCGISCRRECKLFCPPPPTITEVGFIPTSQIDAEGRAAGPSFPPGPTPADNKPAGVGDHPFGSITNIRGVFEIANPVQYKVEYATSTTGPWTPILTPIQDFQLNATPPPIFNYYTRLPDASGWYNVSEMGLEGIDYLTDWNTPAADADQLYYLRLTVRDAMSNEYESALVPARVDNVAPTKPVIQLTLQLPDGTQQKLGCCEKVEQGDGNLIVITLQASDANFSSIDVELLGGCGASYSIVDTGGHALSKTYNGNVADLGYPAPTTFLWNPWAAGISPCCYLIDVRIYDRVIAGNYWSGGHSNENWQSITIA